MAGEKPPAYEFTPERLKAIGSLTRMERAEANLEAVRIVKKLLEEQRYATREEQEALAKWTGFGGDRLKWFVDPDQGYNYAGTQYTTENERRIKRGFAELLTRKELLLLRESSSNAHYTYGLYHQIWEALTAFGMNGSMHILEPAVGSGQAFGTMPPNLRDASILTAGDLEPITRVIARALFPDAQVQPYDGYENSQPPDNRGGPVRVRPRPDDSLPAGPVRRNPLTGEIVADRGKP